MKKSLCAAAIAASIACGARAAAPSLIDIATSILNEAAHAPLPTGRSCCNWFPPAAHKEGTLSDN